MSSVSSETIDVLILKWKTAREMTLARESDVHYALGIAAKLADWAVERLAADRAEREERAANRSVVEYVITCDRENTDEWMEGLAERVNAWAAVVGETDRVQYDARRGSFRIAKGGA